MRTIDQLLNSVVLISSTTELPILLDHFDNKAVIRLSRGRGFDALWICRPLYGEVSTWVDIKVRHLWNNDVPYEAINFRVPGLGPTHDLLLCHGPRFVKFRAETCWAIVHNSTRHGIFTNFLHRDLSDLAYRSIAARPTNYPFTLDASSNLEPTILHTENW